MSLRAIALGLVAAAATGCSPHWTTTLAAPALDRVALSAALLPGGGAVVVGGALGSGGDALLLVDADGAAWRRVATGTDATLWWAHALARDDVWVVGERGTIGRFDGQSLTFEAPLTDVTLYGIWGTADDDLWAVGGRPGQAGVLLRRDAGGWRLVDAPVTGGAWFKVWGSGSDDVFACGEGGRVIRWDGGAWTLTPTGLPTSASLFTVAGRGPSEVYVVGGLGRAAAARWDGTSWTALTDPRLAAAGGLAGVSVDGDGTVYIVGAGGLKLHGRPGALVDDTTEGPSTDLHAVAVRDGIGLAVGGNWLAPAGAAREGAVVGRGSWPTELR